MKRSTVLLILVGVVVLGLIVTGLLATSYHRVRVVEGVGLTPVGGAYISVTLANGKSVDVGRADENGELTFWIAPLPLPRQICAQALFYPPNCVDALSLVRQRIELAVPAVFTSSYWKISGRLSKGQKIRFDKS